MIINLSDTEMFIELVKDKNITSTAKRIYKSQSALNQQLLNLEKDLATPLFDRNQKPWALTKAGEIYLNYAQKVQGLTNDMKAEITSLNEKSKQQLIIGVNAGYSSKDFATLLTKFHAMHSEAILLPIESHPTNIRKLVKNSEVDFGIVTYYPKMNDPFKGIKIYEDTMVLLISANHPLQEKLSRKDTISASDLKLLKNTPFILEPYGTELRTLSEDLFSLAQIHPPILSETLNNDMRNALVAAGYGVALVPAKTVKSPLREIPSVFAKYQISDSPQYELWVIFRQDKYLRKQERDFFHLLMEWYTQ